MLRIDHLKNSCWSVEILIQSKFLSEKQLFDYDIAVAKSLKFQILSNELVRRLSNVKIETIPHREIIQIIEQFISELKTSGYSQKQARELVCSGIRGWRSKHEKRKQKNIPFYRLAEHTVESNLKKIF